MLMIHQGLCLPEQRSISVTLRWMALQWYQFSQIGDIQQARGVRSGAHLSLRVFMTVSSSSLCAAGHNARVIAVRAYICSFFFRICSYCALLEWYCFTLQPQSAHQQPELRTAPVRLQSLVWACTVSVLVRCYTTPQPQQ